MSTLYGVGPPRPEGRAAPLNEKRRPSKAAPSKTAISATGNQGSYIAARDRVQAPPCGASSLDRRFAGDVDLLIGRNPSEFAVVLAEIGDELGICATLEGAVLRRARLGQSVHASSGRGAMGASNDPRPQTEAERGSAYLAPRPGVVASNCRLINKNTLKATADIEVPKWTVKIRGVMWHVKGDSEWIALPSREWLDRDGNRQFAVLIEFTDKDVERRFKDAALAAIKLIAGDTA